MTPAQQSHKAAEICRLAPVIPVLVIDDLAHAAPLARALASLSAKATATETGSVGTSSVGPRGE